MSYPNGLTYIPKYLSDARQSLLINEIDALPWSNELKRRVQHYGFYYNYRNKKIDRSMEAPPMPRYCWSLAKMLVNDKILSHLPDQLIVNEYMPGQGISPHIDCPPCFDDEIVSVSLLDEYPIQFSKSKEDVIEIPLAVGSVLKISGEARYDWYHQIPARKEDNGIARHRRISLTFRKVILDE